VSAVSPAFAQSDRGTITGTIADPAGAVVANAAIEARHVVTGGVYRAQSTDTGNYTLSQLPVGVYELAVAVPGFKQYVRRGLTVEVAQTIRIDVGLEVGNTTESVNVQADAALLKTEGSELSHIVRTQTLDDLPIVGIGSVNAGSSQIRNAYAVTQLIPGQYFAPNAVVKINGAPANLQITERVNVSIRAEFNNIFNRTELPNPTVSNAKLTQSVVNGSVVSGFGAVNTSSATTGTTFSPPRTGTVVARFTF
jgi:hypothetical protein